MHPDALGWSAAVLMVCTFACRDARCMRPLAESTNLAFIGYGVVAALPINLWCRAEQPGAAIRKVGAATTSASSARHLPPTHPTHPGSDVVFNPTFNIRQVTQMAFFDDMGGALRLPDGNVSIQTIDFDPQDQRALDATSPASVNLVTASLGGWDTGLALCSI